MSFDLNGSVDPRITKIGARFLYEAPFFSEILLHFAFKEIGEEEAEALKARGMEPTCYVAIKPRLTFGWYKGFIDTLTDRELTGVIIHEIFHIINLTHDRFSTFGYGNQYASLWNIAADYAINELVLATTIGGNNLALPKQGCFLSELKAKHNYDGAVVHEDIMEFLLKLQKNNPQLQKAMGQGQPGSGQGEPQDGDGEFQTMDDHTYLNESGNNVTPIEEATREFVRNIINGAKAKGYGNLPGGVKEWIDLQLTPPKAPWRRRLIKKLGHELKQFRNDGQRVWNRPSRREGLPLKMASSRPVYVWVDASGSVFNNENFSEFFSEIEAIARLNSSGKVLVGQWDTEVSVEPAEYRRGNWKKIKVAGGGGTDPQACFDWIDKKKEKKSLHVFVTDGEFSYGYDTKGCENILWAVFGSNGSKDPSLGQTKGDVIFID